MKLTVTKTQAKIIIVGMRIVRELGAWFFIGLITFTNMFGLFHSNNPHKTILHLIGLLAAGYLARLRGDITYRSFDEIWDQVTKDKDC